MTTDQTYDPRKYPICAPHSGQSGEPWTRRFRSDFVNGLWSEGDDYSSVAEHALATDDGGANGAAIPPGAGANGVNNKRRRALAQRSRSLFKFLRQHVPDPSFRTAIDQPPIQGNGLAALALADTWYGGPTGHLRLQRQNADWNAASIALIGYDPGSLRRLYTYLAQLNSERAQAEMHSDNSVTVRFLSCIIFPNTLESDAQKEMQAPGSVVPNAVHPPGTPGNDASGRALAGQFNVQTIVAHFEGLWMAQCAAERIAEKPALKKATPHTSNRVDGLELAADVAQLDGELTIFECPEEQGYAIYELEFTDGNGTRELCWNCLGEGHRQRDRSKPPGEDWICPSPRKKRDPKAHAAALLKFAVGQSGATRGRGAKVVMQPQAARQSLRAATTRR